MNTHKDIEKSSNVRALLDSGCSYTGVMRELITKISPKQ